MLFKNFCLHPIFATKNPSIIGLVNSGTFEWPLLSAGYSLDHKQIDIWDMGPTSYKGYVHYTRFMKAPDSPTRNKTFKFLNEYDLLDSNQPL